MVIVTGANGFIGSAMVWQLNSAGVVNIVCVDSINLKKRNQLLANKKYSHFWEKNELIEKLNSGNYDNKVEWIIHMGACSSTTEMDVEFLKENNTDYTRKLFQWCTKHEIPFLYASSAAVYGNGENGFDDHTPAEAFEPLNPYGRSKSEFDVWALLQKKTPPQWYGVRFFNVYGPNEYFKESMSSVVYKAFHEINKTKKLKLFKSHRSDYEDGKQKRDFVYVKDCTNWMMEMKQKKIPSGIYNLGFGTARTWLDLAGNVFQNMNREMDINWIEMPENIRKQYQYFTEAKMTKMWNAKMSKPKWSLEDGIKDYLQNYLLKNEAIL
ncbi:MAG: ADP-glyceromanno-heptose 6-epimerase [Proteobacteria bacterium SG_bin7]|nr:MAG: ADP-glyceromanno-heptose 6-epimerase [Proteobacteria bacterium SG_bin7]